MTCVIAHLTEFGVRGDTNPTADTLLDFSAVVLPAAVTLHWTTAEELDLMGYYLFRSATSADPGSLISDGLLPAHTPGSLTGSAYTFVDTVTLAPGAAWYYWIDTVDFGGATTRHGPLLAALPADPGAAVQYIFLPAVMADAGSAALERAPDSVATDAPLPDTPPDVETAATTIHLPLIAR